MFTVSFDLFRELDPGLQEAVSTLIWAAPRLQSEVTELKIVRVFSFFNLLMDLHVSLCFLSHVFCLAGLRPVVCQIQQRVRKALQDEPDRNSEWQGMIKHPFV